LGVCPCASLCPFAGCELRLGLWSCKSTFPASGRFHYSGGSFPHDPLDDPASRLFSANVTSLKLLFREGSLEGPRDRCPCQACSADCDLFLTWALTSSARFLVSFRSSNSPLALANTLYLPSHDSELRPQYASATVEVPVSVCATDRVCATGIFETLGSFTFVPVFLSSNARDARPAP